MSQDAKRFFTEPLFRNRVPEIGLIPLMVLWITALTPLAAFNPELIKTHYAVISTAVLISFIGLVVIPSGTTSQEQSRAKVTTSKKQQ